jgi:hypothetical protein
MHHAIKKAEGHDGLLRTKKYYIQHDGGNGQDNKSASLPADNNKNQQHESPPVIKRHDDAFVPTLRGKQIFIEITTVGLTQYAYGAGFDSKHL